MGNFKIYTNTQSNKTISISNMALLLLIALFASMILGQEATPNSAAIDPAIIPTQDNQAGSGSENYDKY